MKFVSTITLLLGTALLCMTVASCNRDERGLNNASSDPATYAPSPAVVLSQASMQSDNARKYMDDASITTKVKAALAEDAGLRTLVLRVETVKGVVTITGDVKSQEQKNAVKKAADSVKDVSAVKNEVTINAQ